MDDFDFALGIPGKVDSEIWFVSLERARQGEAISLFQCSVTHSSRKLMYLHELGVKDGNSSPSRVLAAHVDKRLNGTGWLGFQMNHPRILTCIAA
jgi:hypothetical protein